MAKKTLQDNIDIIDNAITDKGTVTISMKSFKWIVGIIISLSLLILGVAWGFKVSLESKINSTENRILDKIEKVEAKVDKIETEDIKANIQMDYRQDGDIKVLYDRTNSRNDAINGNVERPKNLNTNRPNFNPNGN
ncbi:MAG: hypothetical protein HPY57_15075 [Ignavibacteria bacterium]|nr:hypothetical protein [Ignavibacteria bacterium]